MSESLDCVPLGVYVDDIVVDLRAEGGPDVAAACSPIVLPCKAHLRGHGPRPAHDEAFLCREEAMARLPNTFSNQAAPHDVGPRCRRMVAPRTVYGPRREVECALDFSAQYSLTELLLPYPHSFRLEEISE